MAKRSKSLGCLVVLLIVVGTIVVVSRNGDEPASKPELDAPVRDEPVRAERPAPPKLESAAEKPASPKIAVVPEPVQSVKPELTAQQKAYLLQAAVYRAVAEKQKTNPPVLDLQGDGVIGRLEGAFRIVQILGPSTMIADRVTGEFNETVYTVWVEGISTAGQVDGARVSMGDAIFNHGGTKTYTTILGAARTIYAAEALDESMLRWALDRLGEEERKELAEEQRIRQEKIQQARAALKMAEAELDQFKRRNDRIDQYVRLSDRIAMYEANPVSDRIKEILKRETAERDALGTVSEDQMKTFRKDLADLEG